MLLPPVLAHIKSLGHAVFINGDYNLNLFGIRSPDTKSAVFNDLIGCAYKVKGQWHVRYWAATCDPGVYFREKPANVAGTAILKPGQYRNVYKIGKHRGKYDALCQTNGRVIVWRDDNKDAVLDHEAGSEASGYFGINIHASSSKPYKENRDRDADTSEVKNWSAGCQVHATTTGFREMMSLCRNQTEHRGWKTFTYTLVDQWW